MAPPAEARAKLDALGIDAVCELIAARKTLTQIARKAKVSIGSLCAWIEADPERSARARETRKSMAKQWDELAETEVRKAKDPFQLAKARELAHHFRWRSAKIDPAGYGEKIQATVEGKLTLAQIIEAAAKPEEPGDD